MRVGRWWTELKDIKALFTAKPGMAYLKMFFFLVSKVSKFFFWIIDTLLVLIKIKVLAKGDKKVQELFQYYWAFTWTVYNMFNWFGMIYSLIQLQSEELTVLYRKRQIIQAGNYGKGEKDHQELEDINIKLKQIL